MNCRYCDKPISEHGVGRETDACVCETMEAKPELPELPSSGDLNDWRGMLSQERWWKLAVFWVDTGDVTDWGAHEEELVAKWVPARKPTTSADAAMRVWERLDAEWEETNLNSYTWDGKRVYSMHVHGKEFLEGHEGKADDWKLAICHAALMLAAKEGVHESG